ncbi:hypothetical protein ACIPRL_08095 [Streptomyces sp. NPDC090085]|uniref:hypothetical protein n=1 Tax=Streptomyces sp. NPDC090085 TaxID=3365943 RepID=UPI003801F339
MTITALTPGSPIPAFTVRVWPHIHLPATSDTLPMVYVLPADDIVSIDPVTGARTDVYELSLKVAGWPKVGDLAGWRDPAPGWTARYRYRYKSRHLTITSPEGTWYEGTIRYPGPEWEEAARLHGRIVVLTGPVRHPSQFPATLDRGAAYAMQITLTR